MLKFHRKVNSKEGLLGMYITCKNLDERGLSVVSYYSQLFQAEKKKAVIPFPLVMMVDPKLEDNRLQVKILNLVSSFIHRSPIFCECSYTYAVDDYSKSGLDILFYGQDHNDTLSILSTHQERSEKEIKDIMTNQKLLSNKDLMSRNFGEVIKNLKECEKYIKQVLVRTQ
jgi:hypothetical protein